MNINVTPAASRGQPQFRHAQEGVQYELFCGDTFFSVRIIETTSAQFNGIWMYEGGKARGLMSNYEKLTRAATPHVDLSGDSLRIEIEEAGGTIHAKTDEGPFDLTFESPITFVWGIPPTAANSATHQPLLNVTVKFAGREYKGIGYCKRYWHSDIDYCFWRFISGPVQRNGETAYLWTAEANFDLKKYDYFKLATPDGKLRVAGPNDSRHRELEAFGVLDGIKCHASVRHLGNWEYLIRKNNTDLKIIQAFCELTYEEGGKIYKGHALHEIGAGTYR
ncbi:MAG: hypothetical protein AB7K04_08515 [Pseudorhodoplanes sp.]